MINTMVLSFLKCFRHLSLPNRLKLFMTLIDSFECSWTVSDETIDGNVSKMKEQLWINIKYLTTRSPLILALKVIWFPVGKPNVCSSLGNSNLNRRVSCVSISLETNLNGYFTLESINAILWLEFLLFFEDFDQSFELTIFNKNIAPITATLVPISIEYFFFNFVFKAII